MDTLLVIITVACAVGASSLVARFVRAPLPLLQVAMGALCSLPAIGVGVTLSPELFLAALVAPLLFTDAWQMSKREFARNWRVIMLLAFGLALFTVAGTGIFVHWLVPGFSLPVCFALAAVLSPTDVVAVKAIVKSSPLPRQLMHILEGEGLLNDATGLVALRFAVATTLTGAFSLGRAAIALPVTALGGFVLGLVVAGVFVRVVQRMSTPGDQAGVLLMPALPVAVFELAEHFHLSGILAAVGAGIASEFVSRRYAIDYTTRLATQAVWSILSSALNGAIFVILGMQLPAILARYPEAARALGVPHPTVLVLYVIGITAALYALRFIWTFFSITVSLHRLRKSRDIRPLLKTMKVLHLAVTTAGVRGAVTLGAVLTLPLTLKDGSPFPGRDVAIFLAANVILVSLIFSSAVLPKLTLRLRDVMSEEPGAPNEEHEVRLKLAHASIAAVEAQVEQLRVDAHETELAMLTDAASLVMAPLVRIVKANEGSDDAARQARSSLVHVQTLRMIAIEARRKVLTQMLREHTIDDELYRRLVQETDFQQASVPRV